MDFSFFLFEGVLQVVNAAVAPGLHQGRGTDGWRAAAAADWFMKVIQQVDFPSLSLAAVFSTSKRPFFFKDFL